MNHTVDVKRPEHRWTPLQLISPAGRPEPELLQHIACLKQEIADLRDYSERVTIELRALRLKHAVSPASLYATEDDDNGDEAGKSRVAHEEESMGAAAKLGIATAAGKKEASELPLPAWALNMQLMCPLLSAYDDRIKEQQGLLDRRESDVKRMADSIMELTKENESLAQEVRDRTSQLKEFVAGEAQADESGCSMSALTHEKNELAELYAVTKEQNTVLTEQNHLMKRHIESADQQMEVLRRHLVEVEQEQALSADICTQKETLQRLLQETNQALDATGQDRDAFKKRVQELESDLTALKHLWKEAQERNVVQQNQIEDERRKAREIASRLKVSEDEKQVQLQAVEEELAELQKNYSQLSRRNEETEQGTENARKIISYLETKSSRLEREKGELKEKLDDLDQKIQEMTLEKGKLAASTSVIHAQLEKMRAEHSEQTEVERTIMEERFQNAKNQLQQQVDELRQKSQELTAVNAELSLAADAADRHRKMAAAEAAQAQEELQAAVRAHRAIAEQVQQAKAEAERERDTLKEELDALASATAERSAANELTAKKLQAEASQASGLLAAADQRRRQAETCVETLKSQISSFTSKAAALEEELKTMKKKHDEQTEVLRNKHAELVSQQETKLREAREESQLKEQQATDVIKKEEEHRQRLTRQFELYRKTTDAKLVKLRASNAFLRSKLLELVQCIDPSNTKEKLGIPTSVDSTEVSLGYSSLPSICTRDTLPSYS